MTDQPQDSKEDILSQIMDQDSSPGGKGQAEPSGDTPAEPTPEKKAPPSNGRNKRSSVYVYLLVLFGAAFLMLLMAYFVQIRNSETAYSDLRNSMNLSREELMEQIEALKEENESLRQDNDLHEYEADHFKELYYEEQREASGLQDLLTDTQSKLIEAVTLGYLERFCHEGDYLMAAVTVEQYDQYFNQHNKNYGYWWVDPLQAARYMELREKVFDEAGCMVLESFTAAEDASEYTERPYINATALYDEDTLATARNLMSIFHLSSVGSPYYDQSVAELMLSFCDPESGNLERLNGKAFKASTVKLFEQIKESQIEAGILTENEDGTLTSVYTGDGEDPISGVSRETLTTPEEDSGLPTTE